MNDELREILSKMERLIVYGQYNAYYDLEKQLLDYITNLQEENENYKSRVEKAVEYINNYFVLGAGSDYQNNLLNILQNGSDDNG